MFVETARRKAAFSGASLVPAEFNGLNIGRPGNVAAAIRRDKAAGKKQLAAPLERQHRHAMFVRFCRARIDHRIRGELVPVIVVN